MQGHQWGHQSRSRRESSLVRDVPGEGILVGVSVKEEAAEADEEEEYHQLNSNPTQLKNKKKN